MEIRLLLLQKCRAASKEAAIPVVGTTASFCSTGNKSLLLKAMFFLFFRLVGSIRVDFYNFLLEIHYFRRRLAKGPAALVVQTEGQTKALKKRGEAAV